MTTLDDPPHPHEKQKLLPSFLRAGVISLQTSGYGELHRLQFFVKIQYV
jgi:hypothetical protein